MKRLAILSVTIILLIFSTKAQEIKDINEYLYTIDKSIPSYLTFADKGNIKKQRINIKDKGVALKKILKLNDETTTELIDTLTDVVGGFHEVYREYYKNIEIEGSRCIIHYDKDGNAINLNGNFRTINNLEISPQLNEAKALSYALKHIGAEEYNKNTEIKGGSAHERSMEGLYPAIRHLPVQHRQRPAGVEELRLRLHPGAADVPLPRLGAERPQRQRRGRFQRLGLGRRPHGTRRRRRLGLLHGHALARGLLQILRRGRGRTPHPQDRPLRRLEPARRGGQRVSRL